MQKCLKQKKDKKLQYYVKSDIIVLDNIFVVMLINKFKKHILGDFNMKKKDINITTFLKERRLKHEIAEEYVKFQLTAGEICKLYGISSAKTVYRLLHEAVKERIVTVEFALEMEKHARGNSSEKMGKGRAAKPVTYKKLLQDGKSFNFSSEYRVGIIADFARSLYTRRGYCARYYIDPQLFISTFEKAVLEDDLPEDMLNLLKEKIVKTSPTPDEARRYFNKLRARRK